MLFPTIEFALFFAFSFALIWSLNQYNLTKKFVLLALSLAFYASWNWRFMFLLLGIGVISYVVGLYVDSNGRLPFRTSVLILGITLDLSVLCYFKYIDFFIAQLLTVGHMVGKNLSIEFVNVTLPVAISFLTFHAISYIVDVYRGKVAAARSPLDVMLYVSFFPHLVAGPIVQAHEFMPQLETKRAPRDFSFGENVLLIFGGLFKKVVIANYLAVRFVDPIFTDPSQFSRFDLIVAVYAYAIQIYADFSAYTDIAIGIAALLGYQFPQNFNQPYRALGIADFWRRWHMTLSNWLRDYLYIPLGGNRHGALATARNLMTTMLLGGLWHGANWTFVIWGAMHGTALIVDHTWRKSVLYARLGSHPLIRFVDWVATFHFVCFTWLFFRAPSLEVATLYLSGVWNDSGMPTTMPSIVPVLIMGGALTQFIPPQTRVIVGQALDRRGAVAESAFAFAILYMILVMAPSSSAPFIYFQF